MPSNVNYLYQRMSRRCSEPLDSLIAPQLCEQSARFAVVVDSPVLLMHRSEYMTHHWIEPRTRRGYGRRICDAMDLTNTITITFTLMVMVIVMVKIKRVTISALLIPPDPESPRKGGRPTSFRQRGGGGGLSVQTFLFLPLLPLHLLHSATEEASR